MSGEVTVWQVRERLIYRLVLLLGLLLVFSLTATRAAHGGVPTAADFADCNAEAPQVVKAGAASPTTGDHARADGARGSTTSPTAPRAPSSTPPIRKFTGCRRKGQRVPRTRPPIVAA